MLNKKNNIFYSLLVILCLLSLLGCYGPYGAERQYWLASREYTRLVKSINNSSSSDEINKIVNERAADVVVRLRRVELNYPLWPMAAQAKLLIANVYILQGLNERAQIEYESIIKDYSFYEEQCASAMIALASLYKERGDWDLAEEVYDRAIDEYFDTQVGFQAPLLIARYYKSRAMNIEADKAYETAMNLYKEYISNNSDVPQASIALEQLVNCYSDQGEWHEAIRYLQDDIIEESDTPLVLQAMLITGTIYEVQFKNRDKAFEIYRQAIEKFPDDSMVVKISDRLELYGE